MGGEHDDGARLRCRGFDLGWCRVPAFELKRGDILHVATLPAPPNDGYEVVCDLFVRPAGHPAIDRFGTVASVNGVVSRQYAYPSAFEGVRLRFSDVLLFDLSWIPDFAATIAGWFGKRIERRSTIGGFVERCGGISRADARRLVNRLGLMPDLDFGHYLDGQIFRVALALALLKHQVALIWVCGSDGRLATLASSLVAEPGADRAVVFLHYEDTDDDGRVIAEHRYKGSDVVLVE